MDAAPDQAAIGVNVDLGDPEFGGPLELVVINPLGTLEVAAGGIDAGDFLLRHGAGAVHDQRKAGHASLNFGEHVEVQALAAGELEGTVAGADGAGQGLSLIHI